MNRLKFLVSAFIVVALVLGINSCTNENELINSIPNNGLSNENNMHIRSNSYVINPNGRVVNENGILYFPTIQDFTSIREELLDKNQINSFNEAAYQYLSIDSDSEMFITENPINKVFEESMNFLSFRYFEEAALELHMTTSDEPRDFVKEKRLYDEHTKTLFNKEKQIKIGKKYFKLYDDGALLMVGNNDRSKFDELSAIDHYNIETSMNVRVLDFENTEKSFLFNFDNNRNRLDKDAIDLNIGIKRDAYGNLFPVNRTFIDLISNATISYKWIFEDGTTQIVTQPNKIVQEGEVIKLELLRDGITTDSTKIIVRGGPETKCDHIIRHVARNRCIMDVFIEIAWQDGTIGRVEWTLPNGQVTSGTNTLNGNVVRVNADNNGTPYVLIVRLYAKDGSLICWQNHTIICECGITGSNDDEQEYPTLINGNRWRIDVEIWCTDNLFVTSVGSKSRSMRKVTIGWAKRNASPIFCSFKGTLHEGEVALCPETILPYRDETENGGHLEVNIPKSESPKDPNYEENTNACESTHWFKINGITVSYTKNGGKLFLN